LDPGSKGAEEIEPYEVAENVEFLPKPNRAGLYLSDISPPGHLVTAVAAYAIALDGILMTNLRSRGWDLPAGHVEDDETLGAAIRRECLEETSVILGEVYPIGYHRFEIERPKPCGYRYPYPTSYIVSYYATIAEILDFVPTDEASDRTVMPLASAAKTRQSLVISSFTKRHSGDTNR